jgi:hypothetical protein
MFDGRSLLCLLKSGLLVWLLICKFNWAIDSFLGGVNANTDLPGPCQRSAVFFLFFDLF